MNTTIIQERNFKMYTTDKGTFIEGYTETELKSIGYEVDCFSPVWGWRIKGPVNVAKNFYLQGGHPDEEVTEKVAIIPLNAKINYKNTKKSFNRYYDEIAYSYSV